LGFGCTRLAPMDHRIGEDRAARQIRHALDRRVNYLDTARPLIRNGNPMETEEAYESTAHRSPENAWRFRSQAG